MSLCSYLTFLMPGFACTFVGRDTEAFLSMFAALVEERIPIVYFSFNPSCKRHHTEGISLDSCGLQVNSLVLTAADFLCISVLFIGFVLYGKRQACGRRRWGKDLAG